MDTDKKEGRELPEGWEVTALGKLGTVGSSRRVRKNDWKSEGVPFYRAREIAKLSREGSVKNDLFITNELFEDLSKSGQTPETGDLMITGVGTIGTPYIVKKTDKFYFKDASVLIFKKAENLLPEYLFCFFISENCRRKIMKGSKGTTVDTLTISRASILSIPLPPLAEQKRIVSKIEELFSELDAGVESFKQARKQLGLYRQSLLQQAFEGKLTKVWRAANPDLLEDPEELNNLIQERMPNAEFTSKLKADVKSWRQFTLDQLTEYITSGSRGWAKYYSDLGDLFIRAQNLNQDFLNLDNVAYVNLPTKAEGRRTLAKFGDILITITGANTTKTGWVNKELGAAYVSQHVALCRPVTPQIALFIYLFLITPTHGRKTLEKAAYGAGKPGLNLTNIRSLEIPLPSLPEQKEIVRILESQFAVIEQNEREIDAALKRADALRQSILKKAFSGQLVPQDPTDEPASVLFERIREERRVESELGKVKKKAGKINSRATKKRANHNI